jgi:iron complex transport system substrate-binding protein
MSHYPERIVCLTEETTETLYLLGEGQPIFPELQEARLASQRVVNPADVIDRDPEVIFASWCGKPLRREVITSRPGWDAITAVRHGRVYEIQSSLILQPGPASLTDGVRQMADILASL